MPIVATLCHIIKDGNFLLQKKTKGLFGEGKWNGVGGRSKPDESPEECVKREVFEETGLKVLGLKFHGILNFYFGDREKLDWIVHVFSTINFEGEPKSSEEGDLKWFDFEEIPYEKMWGDDKYWLPLLFKGQHFRGNFYFDEKGEKLLDFSLKIAKTDKRTPKLKRKNPRVTAS